MKAKISAIEYALPSQVLTSEDLAREYPDWSVEKIEEKTGIAKRHIAGDKQCASDLGVEAAKKLFAEGTCSPDSIDYLIFCTQSPDYFLPTTACVIQDRLGLPTSAGAIDFNQGCSGFIYGLGLAKGLIETGQARQVLLIAAETYSKFIHPGDKSVRTLFGDAGTATLITAVDSKKETVGPFVYGTDGRGAKNLIVHSGGLRLPKNVDTAKVEEDSHGNLRSKDNLYMNGPEIFTFTLLSVPRMVNALLKKCQIDLDQVDLFVFHQANRFMLESLRKKLKISEEKFVLAYEEFGNTVSSTIPIALHEAQKRGQLKEGMRVMLVGFGVGYSWGATIIEW
ncbi:ketoacyl-ACP synthase III [Desulfuromonas sp. KJ2020]|uniref:3-oxoacyl-ACP synthase III family protein n=1 Tax=Desulfuromonas sp. KJ2020 TaxID=2919173 RepID=UPI0020A77358|nr:ketoacyl-ACP synthase III [Desulfuromonas sp. KJ2020]MCP3177561.1 ketoacyl-ACP synthase III [Desulfuromonas sp. KJ2020]